MGAVYRAVDTRLGRTVALKTVRRSPARRQADRRGAPALHARSARRVQGRPSQRRAGAGLRFLRDGTPYMVMEFLRGKSLSAVLKETAAPLQVDYVADVMLSVCAALRACHHVGIIHRDLKPANIFLCDTDTGWDVKVLDFGISKAPIDVGDLTKDGQILGTPQYLSPEQVNGQVGPEADQYAIGVLLYAASRSSSPTATTQTCPCCAPSQEGSSSHRASIAPSYPSDSRRSSCARCTCPSRIASNRSTHLDRRCGSSPARAARPSGRTSISTPPCPASTPAVRKATSSPRRSTRPRRWQRSAPSRRPLLCALARLATEGLGPTKTAAGARESSETSHSDIAGESALSDVRDTISRKRTRRMARLRSVLVAGRRDRRHQLSRSAGSGHRHRLRNDRPLRPPRRRCTVLRSRHSRLHPRQRQLSLRQRQRQLLLRRLMPHRGRTPHEPATRTHLADCAPRELEEAPSPATEEARNSSRQAADNRQAGNRNPR